MVLKTNLSTCHVKKPILSGINIIRNMPIYSLIIADFETGNEPIFNQDKYHCKTIDVSKQIPCCNGFHVINKLNDLPIEMGYHKSPFGENNVEWFLNENNNIEFQMREFFKLNRKPEITNKSENLFLKTNICSLSDKKFGNVVVKIKH